MTNKLLSDGELKQECLKIVALQEYGTTPSNLSGEQLAKIGFASVDLYQFITADRKRVALEARIDELENNKWLPNEAKWIEQEADRIAELKAQQEEV